MARPGVLGPEGLAGATLLLDSLSLEEARLWLAERGIALEDMRQRQFDSMDLCREAALAGLGLTLLPRLFLGGAVDEGRLVIHDEGNVGSFGYHLVTRPGPAPKAQARFADWLRREALT